MNVSKINFKRGISKGKKNPLEWNEASIEITLCENDSPDMARELADTLFKSWGLEGETTIKPNIPAKTNSKKICAWEGCSKEIDPKYRYCYKHFQQIRRKS